MGKLIDISSYPVSNVLDLLLKDKSTKKNIIWATDTYEELGEGFTDKSQLNVYYLLKYANYICPRIQKSKEAQIQRTRKKAEVFTPAWLCNCMNNHCDEEWFDRKNVFNTENNDNTWTATEGKIEFPANKKWQHYVDSRRLEITCGEAPYLASRYDMSTGELIYPLTNRIGIIDRKLRIVNENTHSYEDWLKWTIRAFEASYGYEYQGDSVLLARINLLLTFVDYYEDRWKEQPPVKLLTKMANKIVWNIWQMDGLKGTVPLGKPYEEYKQMTLFSALGMEEEGEEKAVCCRIYNWRSDFSMEYNDLKEMGVMGKKLFDYVIGNPPYQVSDGGSGASATPVYNKFIDCVRQLEPEAMSLIIPAKWYSGGKGLDKFREQMLNDKRVAVLVDYSNSLDVFPNVDVAGGVCYFVWKKKYNGKCKYTNYRNGIKTTDYRSLDEFDTFIRYPIAVDIVKKVMKKNEPKLDTVISSRKPFGLATNVKPIEIGGGGDIKLRYNAGIGFYKRELISVGRDNIDKYKVIISYLTAEHAGQPDKNGQYRILSTLEKLPPGTVCSETYLLAGVFDNEDEADFYMSYLKTRFVRFLVSLLAMTQHISKAMFKYVPIQDYSKIWTDSELYRKYDLSNDEIVFIESLIKEMV